jgi:hypothetical protein
MTMNLIGMAFLLLMLPTSRPAAPDRYSDAVLTTA